MAAFCRFWRLSPVEYRQLTTGEWRAMLRLMEREALERQVRSGS